MITEFTTRQWRSYYDQVNILGMYLKDSLPDGKGKKPKFQITEEERLKVEAEIAELISMCDKYLDKCRLYPREPRWHYDRFNEKTWASSDKFAYQNLMSNRKNVVIRV